jgi:hypothetical protein
VSAGPDRSQIARDLIVFQVKLFVGGLRDLLLSPVAIIAALLGLVSGRAGARQLFYDVVRLGRRTEDWIDPFGIAHDDAHAEEGLGDILTRIEQQVREEFKRGGPRGTVSQSDEKPSPGEDRKPED